MTYLGYLDGTKDQTLADGVDIAVGTTTGTRIGTSASQKLGFYGKAPVVQAATIAAVDTSTVDGTYGSQEQTVIGDLRTKLDAVIVALKGVGIIANA